MGCALSSAEKEAVQRSIAIDQTLARESAYKQNEIKLLLLGESLASRGGVCNSRVQAAFMHRVSVCVCLSW